MRFVLCFWRSMFANFVGERVGRGAGGQLLFDFRALPADPLETALIVLHFAAGRWAAERQPARQAAGTATPNRFIPGFRCRPTLVALPSSPMSAPNPTIAAACSRLKNAAWIR